MVFGLPRHSDLLGRHTPTTSFSSGLLLADVIPFITNPENRHGRSFRLPGCEDTVRILTDGRKVWFGVISQRQIAAVEFIGVKRTRGLMLSGPPPQLPEASIPRDIKGWWVATRPLVTPTDSIRLVYKQ